MPPASPQHAESHAPALSKALYGGVMGIACLLAIGAAAGVAAVLGGDGRTIGLAAAVVAIGSMATFLPLIFAMPAAGEGAGSFGMAVFFSSGARLLGIVALALVFDQTRELTRNAFWIGALTGAIVILTIESAAAIRLLSKIERARLTKPTRAEVG